MKKSRFTESQIVAILKEAEAGVGIAELARKHGISRATYFNWRSTSWPMRSTAAVRSARSWCAEQLIELRFIQPGNPAQNAFIERFNKTYRNAVLDAYGFDSLEQVREITESWLPEYNEERPHDSLGGVPPLMFLPRPQPPAESSYELCA